MSSLEQFISTSSVSSKAPSSPWICHVVSMVTDMGDLIRTKTPSVILVISYVLVTLESHRPAGRVCTRSVTWGRGGAAAAGAGAGGAAAGAGGAGAGGAGGGAHGRK